MAFFGLLLVVLGGLLIVAGLFGIDYDVVKGKQDERTTEFLGLNMSPEAIFFIGVAAAALVLIGIWFLKVGAKQGLRRRKESKRLNELHDKLEAANVRESKDTDNRP